MSIRYSQAINNNLELLQNSNNLNQKYNSSTSYMDEAKIFGINFKQI